MTNTNKNRRGLRWAFVLAFLFVNSVVAFAQSTVTGVVKDDLGEPLAGTKVQVKGTNNVVMTDANGKFSIRANKGQQLVFSFMGFTEKTVAVDGKPMNIMMAEDAKTLNDVVVIGYGSLARKDVTSSVTTMRSEDLNIGVISEPGQMLQGKVPGLLISSTSDPNGSSSISLRGASSLREGAAMEPYYVIDGVPGVSINLVAPDDIESIDVLRDASATAIYGSKAANGVIIVTTKKGNKNGRTNVSYSGYVAADKTMKTLDMMDANQLRNYYKANDPTGYDAWASMYDFGANTDWQHEVLRTAFTHNHNLSINGGHNKTTYSASVNYKMQDGVVRGTDKNTLTGRSFVQTSFFKDHIDVSLSLNALVENAHNGPTGEQGASVLDGMYYYNPMFPVKENNTWFDHKNHELIISQNYNPMSMANEDLTKTRRRTIQAVGTLTGHIIKGLDWNWNFSYENKNVEYNTYNTTKSQLYGANGNEKRHGQASRKNYTDIKKNMETYLNYNHTWNDVHKLALMGGYSWEQQDNGDGYGIQVYNFYDDALGYHNLGVANNFNIDDGIINYAQSTLRMISFYARANYSFDSRYLFQATVRRDGSSAFGKNNRWGTFPSFSAAWRITEEKFMQNQSAFDDLKLRVGYGVSGNSLGFDAYTALLTYDATGWFPYTDANGVTYDYRTLAANKNANPDLKWERTGMFNIGLDFQTLHGRLSGTIEYYNKATKDLIYSYPVSTSRHPFDQMVANVGEISNKGIEITLSSQLVKKRNFLWTSTLNLSHNSNKVKKLSNQTFSVDYINAANPDLGGYSTTNVQRIMEGSPIGQFYLWEWAGYDETGKSIFNDYNADGNLVGTTDQPDETDRRKAGSAQPKISYGWNNELNWKNWSLTAFFQGWAGNKIFNATKAFYSNVTLMNTGKNMLACVADEQLATDTRAQAPSDRYLENGSYLRLRTLSLGYTFRNLNGWAQSIKLYATVNNVFTITGYNGCDPEVYLGGLTPGMDWRNTKYPRTRTYMFGVNINF